MWLPPRDFVTAQVKGRGSEKYRRGYDNVKSWTSRIDVFKKKFVFIPINQTCVYCAACPPCLHPTPTAHLPSLPGCYRDACVDSLHWSLAIVMNPGNLLVDSSARDATGSSSSRRRSPRHGTPAGQYNRDTTCILFFDSLDVHSQESVCTTIRKCVGAARWVDSVWHSPELCNVCSSSTPRSYLALEAEHGGRAGRASQQIRVTRTQLPVYSPPVRSQPTTFVVAFSWWFLTAALLQVPKQTNSVDCGVFVIKYIHKFLMDWAFIDNPRPITKTWFKKSTIHQLRKSLQARFRLWCDEKALLASSTPNMQAVNWQRNNYGGAKPSPRVASLDDSLKDASGSGSGSGSGGSGSGSGGSGGGSGSGSNDGGSSSSGPTAARDFIKATLAGNGVKVTTIAQGTADWITSRRFRATGTSTQTVLAKTRTYRQAQAAHRLAPTPQTAADVVSALDDLMVTCRRNWLDETKVSTPGMKAGHKNEARVLRKLSQLSGVLAVFGAGMYEDGAKPWRAVSPDGFAVLVGEDGAFCTSVEIKTKTNADTRAKAAEIRTAALGRRRQGAEHGATVPASAFRGTNEHVAMFACSCCEDSEFQALVPETVYRGQIKHQMLVLGLAHVLFVVADVRGRIFYTVLVHRDRDTLRRYAERVDDFADASGISTMYGDPHRVPSVPACVPAWLRDAWCSHLQLWSALRHYAATHGHPVPPSYRFVHSVIVMYNHGMIGADSASASDAKLSSLPVHLDYRARATFGHLLNAVRSAYALNRVHSVAPVLERATQCLTPAGDLDIVKLRKRMSATPYARWVLQAALGTLSTLAKADGTSATPAVVVDGPPTPRRVQENIRKRRHAGVRADVLSPSLSPEEAAFVATKHEWMRGRVRISRAMFNKGGELYDLRLIAPRHHVATRLSVLARAHAKRQKQAYARGSECRYGKCVLCGMSTARACSICLRPLCYAAPDPALMVLAPRSAAAKQCWDVWHAHEGGVPATSKLQRKNK